jgi:TolA-binding protein
VFSSDAHFYLGNIALEAKDNNTALENFKAVLDLRVNQGDISDAQLKKIIGVIDRAALEITQLD